MAGILVLTLIATDALPGLEAQIRKVGFDSLSAERRLKERFEVATLDGFGQFDRAALCAAGLAVRGVLRDFGDAAMAHFVDEAKADPKALERLRRLLAEES